MNARLRGLARLLSVAISIGMLATITATRAAGAPVMSPSGAPLPACFTYADTPTVYAKYDDWQKTLVDDVLALPKSYVPPDLVAVGRAGIAGSGRVRALMIDDLRGMAAAAAAAHAPLEVASAYRSYSGQARTFRKWVADYGLKQALRFTARPGHSEHQLGLAIDFKSKGGKDPWSYGDWSVATTAGRWMKNNAWKFGFVLSYPKRRTGRTCYYFESWHYRYYGIEAAAEIHASGLTTREYLWQRGFGEPDTTAPIADFTAPEENTSVIQIDTSYAVEWTEKDDGSGVSSRSTQRQSAAPIRGTCADVKWTDDGAASAATSPLTETNLEPRRCYRWATTVADGAGNSGSYMSGTLLVESSDASPSVAPASSETRGGRSGAR